MSNVETFHLTYVFGGASLASWLNYQITSLKWEIFRLKMSATKKWWQAAQIIFTLSYDNWQCSLGSSNLALFSNCRLPKPGSQWVCQTCSLGVALSKPCLKFTFLSWQIFIQLLTSRMNNIGLSYSAIIGQAMFSWQIRCLFFELHARMNFSCPTLQLPCVSAAASLNCCCCWKKKKKQWVKFTNYHENCVFNF